MFVVGGAVFPAYFGYNPTHTIEALAYWSAAYIKKESRPGGSLARY
jgi:choline dehydrogenase-like flavoprotein